MELPVCAAWEPIGAVWVPVCLLNPVGSDGFVPETPEGLTGDDAIPLGLLNPVGECPTSGLWDTTEEGVGLWPATPDAGGFTGCAV